VAALVLMELRERPFGTIELFLVKMARSFYATDSRRYETAILCFQIPYLILITTSIVRAWRRAPWGAAPVIVIALGAYSFLMTVTALSIVRYMVPAMGLLFTLVPAWIRPHRFSERRAGIRRAANV